MTESITQSRSPDAETSIPSELLRDFIIRMLVKKSMFQFDAQTVADRLLEADLRGRSGEGIRSLPTHLEAMDLGDIDPRARVLVERETAAVAVLDGSRAMGHVAATKGIQTAIAKAREVGIGIVSIHHSQNFGSAAVYAELAANEGLIGFCTSSSGSAAVTPPGAGGPAVPNAPWAWAVPAAEGPPLVIDLACSALTSGELERLAAIGLPLAPGLAVDAAGVPTEDPASVKGLFPAGPHGFGVGLLATLLSSGLAGAKLAHQKTRSPSSDCAEHFLLAIEIAQFTVPEQFLAKAADARRVIRELPPVHDGGDVITAPGDEGWAAVEQRRTHGVPIAAADLARLSRWAVKLKVETPWPAAN